jgi:hypothetical protein
VSVAQHVTLTVVCAALVTVVIVYGVFRLYA